MGIISIQWVAKLEDNMRFLAQEAAEDVLDEMWWQDFARVIPSTSEVENFSWFVHSAVIEDLGLGGQVNFRDMVMKQASFTNRYAGTGLSIPRSKFLDLDGHGIEAAAEWSTEMGIESQYWPQKAIATAVKAGASSLGYDDQNFFSTLHPINPGWAALGTFANHFTSSSSGAYPGACPIDTSVSAETALGNMAKVWTYIAGIKSSNGTSPRNLRPWKMLIPPSLVSRAAQLTEAKFLAQVAEAGKSAGTGDVTALIQRLGFGTPVMATELGAAFGGSDTTWYVLVKQAQRSRLGALTYIEREPFATRYFTGDGGGDYSDAQLDRMEEYEWHVKGRNVAGYGHPYLLFRVDAA